MSRTRRVQVTARDAFLRILAHERRGRVDIDHGDRTAHEVIQSNRFFGPPHLGPGATSKYG